MTSKIIAVPVCLFIASVSLRAEAGRPVPGSGVIDTAGSYVLQQEHFAGSDRPGILITASDVFLDLNGMRISGPGGKLGTGIEIRSASGVRVSNGTIVNTAFGIVVSGSNNVVLKGLQIHGQGLPVVSPPPETGIMIVQSKNVVVEDNALFNVGLGIFVRGGDSGGNRIAHNTLTAGTNGALGICYNPTPTDTRGPRGDLIYNNVIHGFGLGIQASTTSLVNVFRENTIFFRTSAIDLQSMTNLDVDNTKVQLP